MVYKLGFKVLVLVIIALTRFRFPRKDSLVTVIRRRYGDDGVKLIRKLERTDRKLRKAELDVTYLCKCEELLLIPKFLNFKVSNSHLRNSPSYDSCCKILLKEEINFKNTTISNLREELRSIKDELQLTMNILDYTHVISCISLGNDVYIDNHKNVQDKKLCDLLGSSKMFHNDPSKVIHNYSNYELTSTEKAVLVKGLNFSINPGKLNYGDYCANFELLFVDIKNNAHLSHHNLDVVKTQLKEVALSSYNEHNRSPGKYSNLTKEESDCLRNLSNNKELVIQKSDKGNAIVILNRIDYVDRVKELLLDSTKFQVTNIRDGKIMRHLANVRKSFHVVINKLLSQGKISKQTWFKLDPIGCKPGVLYGLSKVHKALVRGIPKMRPILSAIGTAAYGMSKFLVPLLTGIATGPYTILNSFSFNKEVLKQDATLVMGSLDVDALFTSLPLDETIKISVDELFKDRDLVDKLSKREFKELLDLACKNSLFIFDGIYYNQIDGVAMGSPLGPCLANIFMNYMRKFGWMNAHQKYFYL